MGPCTQSLAPTPLVTFLEMSREGWAASGGLPAGGPWVSERLPPQGPGLASAPPGWACRLPGPPHRCCPPCLLSAPWPPASLASCSVAHAGCHPVACCLSCRLPVEGTWTLSPHSPALLGSSRGQTVQQPSPRQAQGVRRPSDGRSVPRVRVPGAPRPPALQSVLPKRHLSGGLLPPAALALLSPYCIGRTVCLHVELGSSPTPWLSCRGCHCLLWSVRCPPPSPAAGRDRRASCSRGMPCGGALTPRAWPAPLVPRRLPARLPWAPERQGHTLWTRV